MVANRAREQWGAARKQGSRAARHCCTGVQGHRVTGSQGRRVIGVQMNPETQRSGLVGLGVWDGTKGHRTLGLREHSSTERMVDWQRNEAAQ